MRPDLFRRGDADPLDTLIGSFAPGGDALDLLLDYDDPGAGGVPGACACGYVEEGMDPDGTCCCPECGREVESLLRLTRCA